MMETVFRISLLVPVIWMLLQNILFIYVAIWLLRRQGVLTTPIAGMEYSQAVLAAVLLLGTFLIANAAIQACYDTALTYSSQPGPWLSRTLMKYTQYFLIVLLFQFILAGFTWLTLKLFFRPASKDEDSVQNGNLPLSIMLCGIVSGLALGLAKLVTNILESITPHFVVFN